MEAVTTAHRADHHAAHAWQNWWKAIIDCFPNGVPRHIGEEFPGLGVYASRADAEDAALGLMELRANLWKQHGQGEHGESAIYLGARQDILDR